MYTLFGVRCMVEEITLDSNFKVWTSVPICTGGEPGALADTQCRAAELTVLPPLDAYGHLWLPALVRCEAELQRALPGLIAHAGL